MKVCLIRRVIRCVIRRVDGLKVCVFVNNLQKLFNKNLYLYLELRDSTKIILSGQNYWIEETEEVEDGCCVRLIHIQNQQNIKIHYEQNLLRETIFPLLNVDNSINLIVLCI